MTNVSLLVLKNFEYGSDMTISIAEYLEGPYIDRNFCYNFYNLKKFTRTNIFADQKKSKLICQAFLASILESNATKVCILI